MRVEFRRRAPFGFTLPNFHGVATEPCAESLRRLGYVLTVPFSDQTGLIEIQGMESLPPSPSKTRQPATLSNISAWALPMFRLCRNVIETARSDRRATEHCFGSPLHCNFNGPCSDTAGRGAPGFRLKGKIIKAERLRDAIRHQRSMVRSRLDRATLLKGRAP
jgi:hypothetical protein